MTIEQTGACSGFSAKQAERKVCPSTVEDSSTMNLEPDLDNANVGMPEICVFARKLPKEGGFRFCFVGKEVLK